MKIAIMMDPIDSINTAKDTTFFMMKALLKREAIVFYLTPQDVSYEDGEVFFQVQELKNIDETQGKWYQLGEKQKLNALALQAVMLRQDPPFDDQFLYTTHLMDLIEKKGVLVVNPPQCLRDANEKLYTTHFHQFMPKTLITKDQTALKEFVAKHKKIVVKPLDGMGGASIFGVTENHENTNVILETITSHGQKFCLAQKFIPEISKGDARVFIVDGQVIPYKLARIPQADEFRGNLAAGGSGVPMELTSKELEIATTLAPKLAEKGFLFVGLDIIGDYLTEINVTSPTGVVQVTKAYPDAQILEKLFAGMERKISQKNEQ